MIPMRPICRVCLDCIPEMFTGIYDQTNETFVYEKLNLIANINIKPKDGLPDKICSDCLAELENAIIFRQKCETSNNILISAIPMDIGIAKQEDDFSKDQVKEEELDASTDHEYLEEEPTSPPELTLKQEESEEEKHSLEQHLEEEPTSPPELNLKQEKSEKETHLFEQHIEPPVRPSGAIDLQLECHDCGKLFKSKCKLKVHWFKIHLRAQLTCNICKNTFGSFKNLINHNINRTKRCATLSQVRSEGEGKSRVLHCKECVYSTKYIETMTKHLEWHSGERNHKCNLCPAKYVYLNSLEVHMESKHKVFRKSVVCNICGETMGKHHYYKHMRKHKTDDFRDSVKCNICHKVIKHKHAMKVHMERHAGVKKYACGKCGKLYTTSNSLYVHVKQVHSPKDLYNCPECKFTNTSKKIMNKHKLQHSNYDHVCTTCGKFFENATQLSCHEERHTNQNHKCEGCEKTFFCKKMMIRHMNKCINIGSVTNLKKKTKKLLKKS